jgi:hypothetical protein
VAAKRTYNTRRIKATWPYEVQEIAALFSLHKNAVLQWLKDGLQANTDSRPYLVRGDELIRFLDNRQQRKKRKCAPTEFFCFKCRAPRNAYEGIADLKAESPRIFRVKVICAACSTSMSKIQNLKNLSKIEASFHVQQRQAWHLIEGTTPSVNSDMRQHP